MEPVEKIANRLVSKRFLTPPIDVEALIKERAALSYDFIPVEGVSGLCLHMKAGPNKARVIIDMTLTNGRKKFTLAHELGHLIIPWHVGSTVDTIGLSVEEESEVGQQYYELEAEADQFAAELLMPYEWIMAQMRAIPNLAELHHSIAQGADVSLIAAAIRLERFMPAGIVWVIEHGGVIRYRGLTAGTRVTSLGGRDTAFDPNILSYALEHYQTVSGNKVLHWWVLPTEISVLENDPRSWRKILDGILQDIGYEDVAFQRMSINGIVGATNSFLQRQSMRDFTIAYNPEALAAACLQRFADAEHTDFLNHPDTLLYIQKRAKDIFDKPRKPQKPIN